MKTAIYTILFWPAFFASWAIQCLKLGYEAGEENFYQWCKKTGSK